MDDTARSNIRSVAVDHGIDPGTAFRFLDALRAAGLIETTFVAGKAVHPEAAGRAALARFSHNTSDPVAHTELRIAEVEYVPAEADGE